MLILLIGLPGSGKTWYAQNKLVWDYFVDDARTATDFPQDVNKDDTIVIAHCTMCIPLALENAEKQFATMYPEHKITRIFFENNVEKCHKNVENRAKQGDTRDVALAIKQLSKMYIIPRDVKTQTIWSPVK